MRSHPSRRYVTLVVTAMVALAACSGGDDKGEVGDSSAAEAAAAESGDSSPDESAAEAPATTQVEGGESGDEPGSAPAEQGGDGINGDDEEAAAEVAVTALEAVFRGDVDGVIDVLTDECQDTVNRDDVEGSIGFMAAFLAGSDLDIDDIRAVATDVTIDGDEAEVLVHFEGPDGLSELGLDEEDTLELVRDGDRWAIAECDFEGGGELSAGDGGDGDEDLDAELAALGLAGTTEDPIPAGVGAPVGEGMWMSVDAINPDGKAAIEADPNAFLSEIQPGERYVLVAVTVANRGPEEPLNANSVYVQMVGGSNPVGYDSYGCGSVPDDLQSPTVELFVGGVHRGNLCFVLPADQIDGALISVEAGFSGRNVFFDPAATAESPAPLAATAGIQQDGNLAAARTAPQALGTAVDIGGGWTMTVDEFVPDATAEVQAISEFTEPPPEGEVYALATLTLSYDGEEDSLSPFAVDLGAVGDSNASSDDDCFVDLDGQELDMYTDLFKGGSVSGKVCFTIPRGELDSVLLYATGDMFEADPQFFAVA